MPFEGKKLTAYFSFTGEKHNPEINKTKWQNSTNTGIEHPSPGFIGETNVFKSNTFTGDCKTNLK